MIIFIQYIGIIIGFLCILAGGILMGFCVFKFFCVIMGGCKAPPRRTGYPRRYF